jgi:hypothetical protein
LLSKYLSRHTREAIKAIRQYQQRDKAFAVHTIFRAWMR